MQLFNAGLDRWLAWQSGTYEWIMVTAGSFNRDAATTGAVVTSEVSVSGYARQAVSSPVRTVNNSLDEVQYSCDPPDFGTLAAGQSPTAVVLHLKVTNDSDSIPLGWQTSAGADTGSVDPYLLTFADPDNIIHRHDAAAGS